MTTATEQSNDPAQDAQHLSDSFLGRRIVEIRDTYSDPENPYSYNPEVPGRRNIQFILDNGESHTFGWNGK